ncbi:DinB family protein [Alkaliphilus hydrothermalis]|uniref:DinB family protein n=1 Tax=Alkaliphilus hydrothermalis TaxID=1482730 RepID=A0ABS2NLY3_9FIRM|nr:hypothetical protein [Alkaliphilus hydrothermalis]MBM7613917.1 hypothetical protein [Alkaliphilus hydrothermalis]
MESIKNHLHKAFNLTRDLVRDLPTDALKLKLKDLPSNTIGEQLWCIIGARESYLKAIMNEGWVGFNCSLKDTSSKDEILLCLDQTGGESLDYLNSHRLNEVQVDLLLALLEHEIQHHGQLIRYVYGNKLSFPKSWKQRYTV